MTGAERASAANSPSRSREGAGGRGLPPILLAAALLATALLAAACGGDEDTALAGHVEQYCSSFGPSLRLAANASREGRRRSVGIGPIGRGAGAAANERMHFCAGARQGWGDPEAPSMTAAQDFAELADRLDALFVQDADGDDEQVAATLDEMAALADDVARMPLR